MLLRGVRRVGSYHPFVFFGKKDWTGGEDLLCGGEGLKITKGGLPMEKGKNPLETKSFI